MKYISLSQNLFIKNRRKFCEYLEPNSLAVFNFNYTHSMGYNSIFPFRKNRDIFYLSGIDQQDSILLLSNTSQEVNQEILFLKETNEHIRIWEGSKLTKEEAQGISGIKTVYWLNQFDSIFYNLMSEIENIYLNINEYHQAIYKIETYEDHFVKKIKKHYPLHTYKKSNPILQILRSIKEPEEIEQLKTACNITEIGFRKVLEIVKPGIWEYEIEAAWIYEFLRHRANGFSYDPIIASGINSCILHYTKNNKQCQWGELLLMDVGVCYANYNSDLTRTLPVSGRYSKRQKKIYNTVLKIRDRVVEMLVPGNNWHDYHKEVGLIVSSEFLNSGLLNKSDIQNEDPQSPAYKRYFMHNISHYLGLCTHDYGLPSEDFQSGMVFTVEPGIYILEESLGIRIEDVYVIQESGFPENLTKNIPVQIDEIENLMNKT